MRGFRAAVAIASTSAWLLAACGPGGNNGEDAGTGSDAGSGSDAGVDAPYDFYGIAGSGELAELDLAVSDDGRVGIAYFVNVGIPTGGSVADYELRYQEWNAGQISTAETVRTVQRVYGLSLAFQPNGQPAVSYLGGDAVTDFGGMSAFWYQSDAVISRRSANATWAEEIVAKHSGDTPAGNPVSDTGFVVGINPALAFGGSQTFLVWRDVHQGQFPQQDWAGSDLEAAVGSEGAFTTSLVIAGGNDKQAYGGHLDMVIANGQPAVVSDQVFGAAEAPGQNLLFHRRKSDGTWTTTRPIESVGSTQTGASVAYDATLGFAIAVIDRTEDALYFTRSVNEGTTWTDPTPVHQSGSGGWYPSLSINAESHEPSIAHYFCSKTAGAAEGTCPELEDELRISERIGGIWRTHVVDAEGAWHPKLAHLPTTLKRVVAYRHPKSGAIKLAVEK